MRLSVTVVDSALDREAPMWGDATGGWQPPALEWLGTLAAAGVPLRFDDDGDGLLILPDPDAHADLAERAAAAGRPLLTGAPPAGAPARLAAVRDALGALVRPDFRRLLVLRLDDPGASVREHLAWWRHDPVPPATWDALWRDLDGFGRVSLFCCPAWVEANGRVVSSATRNPQEWSAIAAAETRGLADVECHGFTHVHPDLQRWLADPRRHEDEDWYREMWPPNERDEPSWEAQADIIRRWQARCGSGTTLVAPGEAWGPNTLRAARARGLRLFNSWGICRLDTPVPSWSRGVGSPYLDEIDPAWFEAGLPVVGYWHDRDMAIHGPGWCSEHLAGWRDAGARRAWAFGDLARAYEPIEAYLVRGEVEVVRAPDVALLVEHARPRD